MRSLALGTLVAVAVAVAPNPATAQISGGVFLGGRGPVQGAVIVGQPAPVVVYERPYVAPPVYYDAPNYYPPTYYARPYPPRVIYERPWGWGSYDRGYRRDRDDYYRGRGHGWDRDEHRGRGRDGDDHEDRGRDWDERGHRGRW